MMSDNIARLHGLPDNITSRLVSVNDLDVHILEALPISKDPASKQPLIVLVHGFPELAYSWRKIMGPLAARGFAVVAADQRGYGQTRYRGQPVRRITYEESLAPYRMANMVNDVVALVQALGYTTVAAVVGHDFGSPISAYCALTRPDLFKSVVLMSAPFGGPFGGPRPLISAQDAGALTPFQALDRQLAALDPPRKHYMMYSSTPQAAQDLINPPGGLHTFLRAYHHVKSADWKGNDVRPLKEFSAAELSLLPDYYIMPLAKTMPESVAPYAPSAEEIAQNKWIPDDELATYVSQYTETGFQGALNSYRCITDPRWFEDFQFPADKQIEVPAMFIAGAQDWGTFQTPGVAEKMRAKACRSMKDDDFVLIERAGHWVQQEQPDAVVSHILRFLRANGEAVET
ncbi:hypothetical protein HYPSUDRAFT_410702 [Hypholoma sublateritium FD-334 SS-4]|uniref:AB hydrolase-1 domain-containing protein n=1 Tax=Hypholoma sublateritium (strain FD-334 SS-4) TaxID=945553 RepID=A0A0D2Q296_HYPSF|nr:hypothetical protein HYPSUDRAFT_410702 [Hypholoma sublateritium FD-334 SS-4]